ncbi:MAG: zinc-binding dehydrogenase, partial [Deltaproteobacteria bacterium]|nr:zinc-binding dehydrogenase [Deltaproteobacteria bacterium]
MPTAKAIRIREPGGPEVLEVGEIELAPPGPSEVLVEVAAAGLNRADCLQRRGFYPAPPGVPAMGIVGGGSMATRLVTEGAELMAVPDELSLEEAAAIPEVFLTAYDAIIVQGGLEAGRSVLFHAVASGVGTAGIQLASVIGATSIGTSRTADKLPRCVDIGLNHAVLVEDGDFSAGVLEAAPNGVDVILDTIGAAYLAQNVKVIGKKGRIIVIG